MMHCSEWTSKYDEPKVEYVAQGHTTAFQPISKAAHSWSHDEIN